MDDARVALEGYPLNGSAPDRPRKQAVPQFPAAPWTHMLQAGRLEDLSVVAEFRRTVAHVARNGKNHHHFEVTAVQSVLVRLSISLMDKVLCHVFCDLTTECEYHYRVFQSIGRCAQVPMRGHTSATRPNNAAYPATMNLVHRV